MPIPGLLPAQVTIASRVDWVSLLACKFATLRPEAIIGC